MLELIFVKNSTYSPRSVRKYCRKYELIPYHCARCPVDNIWNDKPLCLQLDHIDGVNNNQELKNLRWLCPNCHSQTETFGVKNHKKFSALGE